MLRERQYSLLVGLLPIVYLFHNVEEWLVFSSKFEEIRSIIPAKFKLLTPNDPPTISSVFGLALIAATIVPLVAALIMWNKPTVLNIKILLVIAFVTLINAISHVSSSFALGFISPGFITGTLLCIPFSVAIILFIRKYYRFTTKQYLLFGLSSIGLFFLGIGLLWSLGVLIIFW